MLDLGPGTAVARLTAENLRGSGVRVLALASPEGRRVLTVAGRRARRARCHLRGVRAGSSLPGGAHLDTRYTRATGRPPVILAGMTPTTVDAPIVAAAANAGYMAELAGGGQPDRRTFELRVEELASLLEPGREVVFNTLLLDRHLWELHISRGRAAVRRAAGGRAVRGADRVGRASRTSTRRSRCWTALAAEGMRVNAFKPGTAEQVRQLLAIADAAPHHTIAAHLEGGRAGGHHSWEDLEELLLETYHELRRRAERAGVRGRRHRHARARRRPAARDVGAGARRGRDAGRRGADRHGGDGGGRVGGVAAGQGGAGRGVRLGGVGAAARASTAASHRPARNLNADIHLLDNAASRAGHLLESVAGDEAAVAARRDEIIAALALTAKPYFGELAAMTYARAARAVPRARARSGAVGRYDDGAWGHPSWRARYEALYERFAARLARRVGSVAVTSTRRPGSRWSVRARIRRRRRRCCTPPTRSSSWRSATGRASRCRSCPVLDGEVRRWYMADGLWQAQDDRLGADEVFVIPGPEAVAGITRADEPVAELLARFEAEAIARVTAPPVVARARLAAPGPAPEPLALPARPDGPGRRRCCAAQCVVGADGRTLPEPALAPGRARATRSTSTAT